MPCSSPFLAKEIICFYILSLFIYGNGGARMLGNLVVSFNWALSRSLICNQVIPDLYPCGSKSTFEERLPSVKECVTSSGEGERETSVMAKPSPTRPVSPVFPYTWPLSPLPSSSCHSHLFLPRALIPGSDPTTGGAVPTVLPRKQLQRVDEWPGVGQSSLIPPEESWWCRWFLFLLQMN